MIITTVEMTRLREVRFPVPLKPTWSFGATWSGVARTVVRIHTDEGPPGLTAQSWQVLLAKPLRIDDEGYLRVPLGPGLGIEANEALDDEALIRAHAED